MKSLHKLDTPCLEHHARKKAMKNLAVWIILALMLISLSLGVVIFTMLQR